MFSALSKMQGKVKVRIENQKRGGVRNKTWDEIRGTMLSTMRSQA